jgi:tenascin
LFCVPMSPAKCPHDCNRRGKCFLGFCYCEAQYWGVDCANAVCPGSECWIDLPSQQTTCRHCSNRGSCDNGVCRCMDNFDGPNCEVLLCPNNCWNHGTCVTNLETNINRCECTPPFGGIDCKLPQCKNDCMNRGVCLFSGKCKCNGGFTGTDCGQVDFFYGK